MCARPRSVPDQTIAHAACDVLLERGPQAVTFAEVAQRCGLAPPTLVQRLATRAGLLEAAAAALRERAFIAFMEPSPEGRAHLETLVLVLAELSAVQHGAVVLAHSVDLSGYASEVRKQISYRLAVAIDAGELPRCDVAQLARTLQIAFAGAVALAHVEGRDASSEVSEAIAVQLSIFV